MKLITRHTDYAVSAICYIAQKDDPVTAAQLCTELDMPYAFTRGILQKLQTNGILISSKGKAGGFSLAKKPDRINLYDLINIFQDTLKANGCVFKKHPCPRQTECELRKRINRVSSTMKKEFEAITISSLVNTRARHTPQGLRATGNQ